MEGSEQLAETLEGSFNNTTLHCSKCLVPLKQHSVFFELNTLEGPQSFCHVVCPVCCCESHAARGCAHFQCPCKECSNIIIGHTCVRWNSYGERVPDPPVLIQSPNPNLDVHRLFRYEPMDTQRKHIVISVSWIGKEKQKEKYKTLSAVVPKDASFKQYDDVLLEKLLTLSRILFPCVHASQSQLQ